MPIKCPGCGKYMIPKDIKGIQVDYCELGCKGIWLDEGEGQQLKKKVGWDWGFNSILHDYHQKDINDIMDEKRKPCPKCKEYLEQIELPSGSDLYLDICRGCKGIYFDKGELKRYLYFLKEQDKYQNLDLHSTDRFQAGCSHLGDVLSRIYWLSRWF